MALLKDKVQNALEEGRMLILGSQLLLGFHFLVCLEKGFEKIPLISQAFSLVALGMILLAIGLLLAPTAYHQIVEQGEDTEEIHSYATRVMTFALLPFALALGLDMYIAATKIAGNTVGSLAGVFSAAAAVFFWYGLEVVPQGGRRSSGREVITLEHAETNEVEKARVESSVTDKIKHVLTEARMVLPGVQALLGFQLLSSLMEAFDTLPAISKYIHLGSMLFVGLAMVLLMTPAAYHRIVEKGEETEHFHRFASRMVLAAMVPLALGICGDVYVVVLKVIGSTLIAIVSSVVALAVFYELWFGLTVYRRIQRDQEERSAGGQSIFGTKQ